MRNQTLRDPAFLGAALQYLLNTPTANFQFAANRSLLESVSGSNSLITTSRASSIATFFDASAVLQRAVANLILKSEEFNDPYWLPLSAAVTANNTTAHTGAFTADALIEDGSTGEHRISSTAFAWLGNTQYTFSIYVKANGRTRFDILFGTSANWVNGDLARIASFNLTDGTVSTPLLPGIASIHNIGNGWFRCRVTATSIASPGSSAVFIRMAESTGSASYTGNNTFGLWLFGAQLEQSSTMGEYVPTGSTINSVPRFNTAQITLESLGLLLEGEQTNSIRNSTMQGASAGTPGTAPTNWSMTGSANGLTRTLSLGTANGINYIDARYVGTTTAAGTISIDFDTNTGIVASSGQSWAGTSFTAISGGSLTNITNPQIIVIGRDAGGVLLETFGATIAPTSQLIRYQRLASFVNANTARVQLRQTFAYANGVPIDVTIRLGLPQLERDVPTTPIGTSSGSVIRSADFADSTLPALLTASTIFVEFRSPAVGIRGVISLNDGTSGNRIDIRTSGTTAQVLVVTGGITQTTLSVGTVTANTRARIAVCLASGRVAASLNGGAAVSATATRPSVDRVAIGRTQAGEHLKGTISALTSWAVEFTDSMLSAQST